MVEKPHHTCGNSTIAQDCGRATPLQNDRK